MSLADLAPSPRAALAPSARAPTTPATQTTPTPRLTTTPTSGARSMALGTAADTDNQWRRNEPWPTATRWRARSFHGGVLTDEQLAAASGPKIAVVVGVLFVVLWLSVCWVGGLAETASGFWPPSGLALTAMLVLPIRRWGWIVAAMVFVPLVAVTFAVLPIVPSLWWALGNCVEAVVGALVLRAFWRSRWCTRGRLMLVFLVGAVVAAPMIGGAIGAIGTVVGYGSPWLDAWIGWFRGDGLGILVVVPLLMTDSGRHIVRRTGGETFALVTSVAIATAFAFADFGVTAAALLPYLILVLLIWAGMRFGTSAVAAAGFVVSIGANVAIAMGTGPFSPENGHAHGPTLQVFLAIALVTSFVVAAMASDLADRNEVNRLLRRQATHDALTGLPNRVLFAERLRAALDARHETGRSVAVLLIDLDDFKQINDRHGHPAGDDVLTIVAQLLLRSVRPGDLLARLGGDEFVVLCGDLEEHEQVHEIARAVTEGLVHPIAVGGIQYQLTGCIGIAVAGGDDPLTSTDLLRRADIALYRSKRTTGVSISLFDDALEAHTQRRADLDVELRGAIDRGEMILRYQPIVCLTTGRVTGFEALARWDNRRFGIVGPDEFIAIAEETGLISVLGDWVLATACRQAAEWRAEGAEHDQWAVTVAVNVSTRQLSDNAFPDRVRKILYDTALPASALTLEITETAVMDDLDASVLVLTELRQIGVTLAIDDFGTGYASMTYLRRLPVNTLKIDRIFVSGLGTVAEDAAIVESIINLGHSFGIDVVAEGIETTVQLQHLIELGCDHGQGFLWSHAVDAHAAAAVLHRTFDTRRPAMSPAHQPDLVLP